MMSCFLAVVLLVSGCGDVVPHSSLLALCACGFVALARGCRKLVAFMEKGKAR